MLAPCALAPLPALNSSPQGTHMICLVALGSVLLLFGSGASMAGFYMDMPVFVLLSDRRSNTVC